MKKIAQAFHLAASLAGPMTQVRQPMAHAATLGL